LRGDAGSPLRHRSGPRVGQFSNSCNENFMSKKNGKFIPFAFGCAYTRHRRDSAFIGPQAFAGRAFALQKSTGKDRGYDHGGRQHRRIAERR
jgi:hypothetical protein